MCLICVLIQKDSLPKPKELVSHVGELDISDDHKVKVYDLALDKANELGLDTLEYTADLAGEIMKDLLRKT